MKPIRMNAARQFYLIDDFAQTTIDQVGNADMAIDRRTLVAAGHGADTEAGRQAFNRRTAGT